MRHSIKGEDRLDISARPTSDSVKFIYWIGLAIEGVALIRGIQYYRVNPNG